MSLLQCPILVIETLDSYRFPFVTHRNLSQVQRDGVTALTRPLGHAPALRAVVRTDVAGGVHLAAAGLFREQLFERSEITSNTLIVAQDAHDFHHRECQGQRFRSGHLDAHLSKLHPL